MNKVIVHTTARLEVTREVMLDQLPVHQPSQADQRVRVMHLTSSLEPTGSIRNVGQSSWRSVVIVLR
jgi:hypothetical protein